jgi:hypothetical protein
MRTSLGTLGLVLAVTTAGCGGSNRPAARSGEDVAEGDGSSEGESGGKSVNPETFDQLTRVFNNKRPAVGRCYSDAVQSGKLDKKAKGRLTVQLAITANGKPKGVKTASDTLHSADVETCVIDLIKTWDLPEPGDDCEFSFSYDFEPE